MALVRNDLYSVVKEVVALGGTLESQQEIFKKQEEDLKGQRVDVDVNTTQIKSLHQSVSKKVLLPDSVLRKVKRPIPFPADFTWKDAPIQLFVNGVGEVTTDFDASSFKPDVSDKKTYYVSLTGKDTNDGLTPQTPLKSVHVARLKEDVGTIEIDEGFYEDQYAFNNSKGEINSKDLIIRGKKGANVVLGAGRFGLTWTKTEGKANVYQATRSQVSAVFDMKFKDDHGDYKKLDLKASINEVEIYNGSYYVDENNVLYVHTVDSRIADNQMFIALDIYNFRSVGNYKVYLENLKFYGGKEGCVSASLSTSTDTPIIAAKNCEFKYSTNGAGGFMTLGVTSYAQNCVCAWNSRDGFNYHKGGPVVAKAIEVNCIGRSSGIGRGTDQDNGSTMHDGGKAIRVNCTYHSNEGPNVHDIDEGTEAWVLGCESYGSAAINPLRRTNYRIENYAQMWVDSGIGYESDTSLYASVTCEMKLRNCAFDRDDVVLGKLEYYEY